MVWSDPKIRKLAREFVTVTDEVYMLYPEDEWNLDRVKDAPQHKFFKRYGEAMPAGDWNHPGTKQGIYMIGPDAEYLEGRFAANGFPEDIAERMQRALKRWQKLRKQKGYKNEPVPAVESTLPPALESSPFVLRVNSRDLPRDGREGGVRFDKKKHASEGWRAFTKWAWNENWLAVEDGQVLVPRGKRAQAVDESFVRRLTREMLIDNVRGQASRWSDDAVKQARISMRRVGRDKGVAQIVYRGEVRCEQDGRSITAKIYGEGRYDESRSDFVDLQLLVLGMRVGAQRFNQRGEDPGPAPIGFAITRWELPASPK